MKTIFSGIQPSGTLTLGNYLGAMKHFVELQDDNDCYFCIVDEHAITVPQEPLQLRKNIRSLAALYIAAGIDPTKSTLFIQSEVSAHTELGWIMQSIAYIGELERMTQFKDKSDGKEAVSSALLTYPPLMAADILLYNTDIVPVGEDQKQHLELSRDIAVRFNNSFGKTFTVPEVHTPKVGSRIMSLQQPESKMSKSDENANGTIFLLDSEKDIIKKFKRAVTDNEGVIQYRDEQPGIKNLITIYSKLANISIDQVMGKYEGKGYGALKTEIGELAVDSLKTFKTKYDQYMSNEDYLVEVYTQGAQRAKAIAEVTIKHAKANIGLV